MIKVATIGIHIDKNIYIKYGYKYGSEELGNKIGDDLYNILTSLSTNISIHVPETIGFNLV